MQSDIIQNTLMNKKIKHSGIVRGIKGNAIEVNILQTSACAGCKVASHCNASEAQDKVISIESNDAELYNVGDSVMVSTTNTVGLMASAYAYVFPLILMVTVIVVMVALTDNEGIAALAGLSVLVPYYIALYLLRNNISRQVNFEIEKIISKTNTKLL